MTKIWRPECNIVCLKLLRRSLSYTKVAIKYEKLTSFGGIFSIMEQFDSKLSSVIDSTLGLRCEQYGYQYSEIIRSFMSVYFCCGSCIEDVTTHLMYHLSLLGISLVWEAMTVVCWMQLCSDKMA